MVDYSEYEDCCLNCEDRICNKDEWCDHCLCLNDCDWYEVDEDSGKGYCSLVRDSPKEEEEEE